jgi:hypothetical protein
VGEGGVAGLVRNNNERKVQGPFSTGTITGKEKRKQARGTNVRGISQKLPQQGLLSSVRGRPFLRLLSKISQGCPRALSNTSLACSPSSARLKYIFRSLSLPFVQSIISNIVTPLDKQRASYSLFLFVLIHFLPLFFFLSIKASG